MVEAGRVLVDSVAARRWIEGEQHLDYNIRRILDVVTESVIRDRVIDTSFAGALGPEAGEVERLLDRAVGPRRKQVLGVPDVPQRCGDEGVARHGRTVPRLAP